MATEMINIGSQAPVFNLPGIDGNNYSTKNYPDKNGFVVIFSCNHCPYVKAYEDRIIALQRDFNNDIQFLVINSNDSKNYPEDSFENMKMRANEMGFNFPYLRDKDQSVAKAFGATHTPEIFLLDKNRVLVFHGKIDDNWKEPGEVKSNYLKDAINQLLVGEEISTKETFTIGCTIKWK